MVPSIVQMALFERDGVRIHYEIHGEGEPLLLIAPGGMHSTIAAWDRMPWSVTEAFADRHRVILMDQRNAGDSWAPVRVGDGWATYTRDQIALLDHLKVDRFKALGMCIGGPYILNLASAVADRLVAAAILQPVGLEDNREAFHELFDGWRADIEDAHPEADEGAWMALREAMWGGDFMFSVDREDAAMVTTPLLVMLGDDRYHPASISRALVQAAPNARLVERWKEPELSEQTRKTLRDFFAAHSAP